MCESCDVSLTIVSTLQTRNENGRHAAAVTGFVTGLLGYAANKLSAKRDRTTGGFSIVN